MIAELKQFFKDFLASIFTRKFLIFMIGTALLFFGKLDPMSWLILTGVYLGVNVIEKFSVK